MEVTKTKAGSSDGFAVADDVLHISGYLFKKSREGKWQKRWFETNGCFLTYYKNRKMEKLLAALSLPQVGAITLIAENDPVEDNDGTLFTIELNDRLYILKAPTREEAARWVHVLGQLKNGANQLMPTISDSKSGADFEPEPIATANWNKSGRGLICCGL